MPIVAMSPRHSLPTFLLLPLILILLSSRGDSSGCLTSTGTFLTNSTYDYNLRALLSNIAATTPILTVFNSSEGYFPNEVFGIAYCNNTRSPSVCDTCSDPVCRDCIDAAEVELYSLCANIKTAVGINENCAMAWSNTAFVTDSPPAAPVEYSPPPPPAPWGEYSPPPPETPASNEYAPPPPPPPSRPVDNGTGGGGGKKKVPAYAVAVPVVLVLGVVAGALFFLLWSRRVSTVVAPSSKQPPQKESLPHPTPSPPASNGSHVRPGGSLPREESLVFNYGVLKKATNNFSESNLLGKGGFGPVYKGKLHGGNEIAVKKLEGGLQGVQELETEVLIVTALRHRNLVRVLGYCLEGDQAMLVYEFLPNTSLDRFLIDPKRCEWLTWTTRFKIIKGISRGLQYLHQDSRVAVVHRDLKTSNILLDAEMNPKISDFGLARLFDDTQTRAFTMNIAGTMGYIAPEYLREGIYSLKADVYSFGIIVLEIVTGKLVTSYGHGRGLVDYVVRYWNDGIPLEALDSRLGGVCQPDEVTTSIYVGLLCALEDRKERPDMEVVVGMLNNPQPLSQISAVNSQA